jgi:hypothetical protein
VGIAGTTEFDRLFRIKNLRLMERLLVETRHALSMQGVGIVLGIVKPRLLWPHDYT